MRKILLALIFLITPSYAAELLMVEREGCVYCAHWNKTIAPIYPKTDIGKKLPLKRFDLIKEDQSQFQLKSKLIYTPTFVILDNNKEIARMEGFISEDFFWSRLEAIAKELK